MFTVHYMLIMHSHSHFICFSSSRFDFVMLFPFSTRQLSVKLLSCIKVAQSSLCAMRVHKISSPQIGAKCGDKHDACWEGHDGNAKTFDGLQKYIRKCKHICIDNGSRDTRSDFHVAVTTPWFIPWFRGFLYTDSDICCESHRCRLQMADVSCNL